MPPLRTCSLLEFHEFLCSLGLLQRLRHSSEYCFGSDDDDDDDDELSFCC